MVVSERKKQRLQRGVSVIDLCSLQHEFMPFDLSLLTHLLLYCPIEYVFYSIN